MDTIPAKELNELFLDTLRRCSMRLLNMSNEEIYYNLFEDYASGVVSFLHQDSLDKLFYNGFFDKTVYDLCLKLREKSLPLVTTPDKWIAEDIRKSPLWIEIFKLSDEIKEHIAEFNERKLE